MENFTPTDVLNKERYALGPLEVGRVSRLVQSRQIPHLYPALGVVSFSGQLPSLGRGGDSPGFPTVQSDFQRKSVSPPGALA